MMNKLYRNYLNLLLNFFISSVKLIAKQRVGSKIIERYDKSKIPLLKINGIELYVGGCKNKIMRKI